MTIKYDYSQSSSFYHHPPFVMILFDTVAPETFFFACRLHLVTFVCEDLKNTVCLSFFLLNALKLYLLSLWMKALAKWMY